MLKIITVATLFLCELAKGDFVSCMADTNCDNADCCHVNAADATCTVGYPCGNGMSDLGAYRLSLTPTCDSATITSGASLPDPLTSAVMSNESLRKDETISVTTATLSDSTCAASNNVDYEITWADDSAVDPNVVYSSSGDINNFPVTISNGNTAGSIYADSSWTYNRQIKVITKYPANSSQSDIVNYSTV